jgi:hypothetical protein
LEELKWNSEKNDWLRRTRGVSFEEITQTRLLGIIQNPSRADQKLMLYELEDYVWVVPCVKIESGLFLKTMYPSRRYQKLWKNGLLDLS